MRMSQGVEWAVHGCVHLSWLPEGAAASAARLAAFNDLPAPYLNKQLQALVRHGIVSSKPGPRGGFALARPASEITVLDVVEAIEGTDPAFRCAEIRQRGPLGASPESCRVPCQIARIMHGAEDAWRAELRASTVGQIADDVAAQLPDLPTGVRAHLVG